MLIGGGAIDAMKKSYENNRNILGRKKTLKELMDEQGISHHHTKYTFKKADPIHLKELHDRLIIENRNLLIRQIAVLVFLAVIIFGGIYLLVF